MAGCSPTKTASAPNRVNKKVLKYCFPLTLHLACSTCLFDRTRPSSTALHRPVETVNCWFQQWDYFNWWIRLNLSANRGKWSSFTNSCWLLLGQWREVGLGDFPQAQGIQKCFTFHWQGTAWLNGRPCRSPSTRWWLFALIIGKSFRKANSHHQSRYQLYLGGKSSMVLIFRLGGLVESNERLCKTTLLSSFYIFYTMVVFFLINWKSLALPHYCRTKRIRYFICLLIVL